MEDGAAGLVDRGAVMVEDDGIVESPSQEGEDGREGVVGAG